jgi:tRNA (mo5U34)-methyltransferase
MTLGVANLPLNLNAAVAVLAERGFSDWAQQLEPILENMFMSGRNGNLPRWLKLLEQLPTIKTDRITFDDDIISVGCSTDISRAQQVQLKQELLQFSPWRKGPFSIFGVLIDAEWQSQIKWQRLSQCIAPLAGKRVLDVGCGNGYYAMRMLGAGAQWVLGVDPSVLALIQVTALQHFMCSDIPFTYLPIGMQTVPHHLASFDTVFSMGVLYHRRDPIEHLKHLRHSLVRNGQLVLETLVIDGAVGDVLVPDKRYAQMNNVWYLPSVLELCDQLKKLGFTHVHCADVSCTDTVEQRSTEWMTFHSLENYLHESDSSLTVERYPRPRRAIILAEA